MATADLSSNNMTASSERSKSSNTAKLNDKNDDDLESNGTGNDSISSSMGISTPQRHNLDSPIEVIRRSTNAISFPRRNSSPLPQNRGRNITLPRNQERQNSGMRNLSTSSSISVNGSAPSSSSSASSAADAASRDHSKSEAVAQAEVTSTLEANLRATTPPPQPLSTASEVIREPPKPLTMEIKSSQSSANTLTQPIPIKPQPQHHTSLKAPTSTTGLALSLSPSRSKSSIANPQTTSLDVISTSASSKEAARHLDGLNASSGTDKDSINSKDSTDGQHSLAESSLLGLEQQLSPQLSGSTTGFFSNVFNNRFQSTPLKKATLGESFIPTHSTANNDSTVSLPSMETSDLSTKAEVDSIEAQIEVTSPNMLSYRPTRRGSKARSVSSSSGSPTAVFNSPLKQVNDNKATNVQTVPSSSSSSYSTAALDTNLYSKEQLPGTNIHYAAKERHDQFLTQFPAAPKEERLLDDFVCGLTRPEMPLLPIQGRLYVTCKGIHFYSSILGWSTSISVGFREIDKFEKSFSVGVFNNGIKVVKRSSNSETNDMGLVGFLKRDTVLFLLEEAYKWWEVNFPEEKEKANSSETTGASSEREVDKVENDYNTALMSIDGDTPGRSAGLSDSESDDYSEIDTDDDLGKHDTPSKKARSAISESHTVHRFKQNIKYKAPDSTVYIHQPTSGPSIAPPMHPNELELAQMTLPIPPSLLFQLLFDNSNTDLTLDFLKSQDSSEFSPFSSYINQEDIDTDEESNLIKQRTYSYQKALNFPVGPKSTTCEVKERILQENPEDYYEVVNITKTPSVPSGGSFDVRTRYIMTWGDHNDTVLRISFWVQWTGSSWMKAVIEKSCKSGQEEATKALSRLIADYVEEYVESGTEIVTGSVEKSSKKKNKEKKEKKKEAQTGSSVDLKKQNQADTSIRSNAATTTTISVGGFFNKVLSEISATNIIIFAFLLIIIIQQTLMISQLSQTNSILIQAQTQELSNQQYHQQQIPQMRGNIDEDHLILKYLNEKNTNGNLDRLEMSKLIKKEIESVIESWVQQG